MARPTRKDTPHIRDVAARAGVSVGDRVARAQRHRRRGCAQAGPGPRRRSRTLHYRPSSLARNLSLGRTGTIGVIAPFFTHLGTLGRLRGITERAAAEDYDVMIFDVETPKQRDDALLKLRAPRSRRRRARHLGRRSPTTDVDQLAARRRCPPCSSTSPTRGSAA